MPGMKTYFIEPAYGRLLADFKVGETYHHPWEVTLDDGLLSIFAASFLDPNPLYSSTPYARALGFKNRVVHPLVLVNLAIGYSVHDVSEQAIAHLAYINVQFPNAAYAGDTLTAHSTVLGVRKSESQPDRGIVHVRTVGVNQNGLPLITFERKALIPAGTLTNRAHPAERSSLPDETATDVTASSLGLPPELSGEISSPRPPRLRGFFEDFEVGDVIIHENGRTVGESEHMQLTMLSRNSHPLHFDEVYSKSRSLAGTRVVCGPLVFAWIASLASRDTTANALWECRFDDGKHPAPVLAGDTLFAASKVIGKGAHSNQAGIVRFKLIGLKNVAIGSILKSGIDLFDCKHELKVFETEREVLLPLSKSNTGS